jgi:hypothetical protein
MGGWCRIRETCPNYHALRFDAAERLCVPGTDGRRRLELIPVYVRTLARRPLLQLKETV